ncbi:hypothetical protein ACN27E_11270 [Mycobacterium sp. WMMD1722]|uniref:hypothetical protein n=1 Tax=Mycobacterium sp. WMMD1722 TaxID=3404117 RepID=UPI003BF4C694
MRKRLGATIGAMLMAPAMAVSMAGAAAAQDAQTWEMPDFIGMTLQGAVDTVASTTDSAPITLSVWNTTGPRQEIANPTNWYVCYQRPVAGSDLTLKSRVSLGLRRPNTDCWG